MLHAKTAHGFRLTEGWICVEIKELFKQYVPCWQEYPTHSDEVEVGSFSAWPTDELTARGSPGITMSCNF